MSSIGQPQPIASDGALPFDVAADTDGAHELVEDVFQPDQEWAQDSMLVDQMMPDQSIDMGPTTGAYTTAQVDEIFLRDCGSCHNSTANPPLNNGVLAWVNRGSGQSSLPLIRPGNHRQSYLYHKMADTHRDPPSNGRGTGMPMGRQLYSEMRMERMALWIDQL